MNKLSSRLRQFVKSEDGISSVEYALLLAFVGGGVIVGASLLGSNVGLALNSAAGAIDTDVTTDGVQSVTE